MAYIYFIILILSLLIIIWLLSNKFNILSNPNERSSHIHPKSRLGGLGIFISIILSILFFNDINIAMIPLIGFIFIFTIGLIDDLIDLPPIIKLVGQSIACAILIYGEYYFLLPYIPNDISIIINFFTFLALLNAVNFMDGLDGLVGGYLEMLLFTLIILVTTFDIPYYNLQFLLLLMMVVLAFLAFNQYPSSIFMGDSGSLSLGYMLIFISVDILNKIEYGYIIFIILFLCPLLDLINVISRRLISRKSPFSADKRHIHHTICRVLKSQSHTFPVIILYACMGITMIIAYLICKIVLFS